MGRSERTRTDIKRAFLEVLADKRLDGVTISEVARRADVSRSTFYVHYGNVTAVYEDLVSEIAAQLAPIGAASGCEGCSSDDGSEGNELMPFCEMLGNPGKYAPVIRERQFLETLLSDRALIARSDLIRNLMEGGMDFQQAYSIFVFQMSGCFSAKRILGSSERDWPKVRQTVDRFISSGVTGTIG